MFPTVGTLEKTRVLTCTKTCGDPILAGYTSKRLCGSEPWRYESQQY